MEIKLSILIFCTIIPFFKCDSQDNNNIYQLCEDVKCFENKFVQMIDEVDAKQSVSVLDGVVKIERIGGVEDYDGNGQSGPRKDEGFIDRLLRYITCHEVKLKLPASIRDARSLITETRSKKLRKLLLPLLLLLKLKAAIIIPAVLSAIALVAFKGMGAGVIAMVIAAASAFKSLLLESQTAKKVSFEVVPPPHWSRAGYAASAPAAATILQELPYHGFGYGYQSIPQ